MLPIGCRVKFDLSTFEISEVLATVVENPDHISLVDLWTGIREDAIM